jgi:DNA-binding transcriptional MerR regulator
VREFAELTGVTVRALHQYDRLGLLRPRRTAAGYRLYGARELERLEQIVALKFIGIPLQRMKAMLDRDASDLPDTLRMQRTVLEEKRRPAGSRDSGDSQSRGVVCGGPAAGRCDSEEDYRGDRNARRSGLPSCRRRRSGTGSTCSAMWRAR